MVATNRWCSRVRWHLDTNSDCSHTTSSARRLRAGASSHTIVYRGIRHILTQILGGLKPPTGTVFQRVDIRRKASAMVIITAMGTRHVRLLNLTTMQCAVVRSFWPAKVFWIMVLKRVFALLTATSKHTRAQCIDAIIIAVVVMSAVGAWAVIMRV